MDSQRGLIGVVWQDDMLLSNLTVRETIAFAAKLKTPASAFEQIDIMIDDILNELGLTEIHHSYRSPNDEEEDVNHSGYFHLLLH